MDAVGTAMVAIIKYSGKDFVNNPCITILMCSQEQLHCVLVLRLLRLNHLLNHFTKIQRHFKYQALNYLPKRPFLFLHCRPIAG